MGRASRTLRTLVWAITACLCWLSSGCTAEPAREPIMPTTEAVVAPVITDVDDPPHPIASAAPAPNEDAVSPTTYPSEAAGLQPSAREVAWRLVGLRAGRGVQMEFELDPGCEVLVSVLAAERPEAVELTVIVGRRAAARCEDVAVERRIEVMLGSDAAGKALLHRLYDDG